MGARYSNLMQLKTREIGCQTVGDMDGEVVTIGQSVSGDESQGIDANYTFGEVRECAQLDDSQGKCVRYLWRRYCWYNHSVIIMLMMV